MAAEGSVSIAIVCEAAADRETARLLADRVLCEQHPWLAEQADWTRDDPLPHLRAWRGLRTQEPFLDSHRIREEAEQRKIKARGFFGGSPAQHMAQATRKALLLLEAAEERPDAVVFLSDRDDQPERHAGLSQARDDRPWSFPVIIGLACPEREAWVLAGFEPADERERERLRAVRQELGFDPRLSAQDLSSKRQENKRDCKRVLGLLTDGDAERERRCLREPPLALLRERGCGAARGAISGNGLKEFLDEVSLRLGPCFR